MRSALASEYIPASPAHVGGANGTINRIVVHGTVSACVVYGARNNARYFQNPAAGGAAHYITDPGFVVCSVDEASVAHHAPPNTGSIGVEFTDWQGMGPEGDIDLWGDLPHQQMLALGAKLVVDIAGRHGVPLVWLSVADLLAGKRGVTSHANVALAWHLTDHTDPGRFFPTGHFMDLIAGTAPAPAPHEQEPEMQFIAEYKDKIGTLWLVDVAARGNTSDHDPTHKYGTRTRVIDPATLYRLAEQGIPVRSGQHEGMELFAEVV